MDFEIVCPEIGQMLLLACDGKVTLGKEFFAP